MKDAACDPDSLRRSGQSAAVGELIIGAESSYTSSLRQQTCRELNVAFPLGCSPSIEPIAPMCQWA